MKITLCTLFNINYIDKGLTLYESLEKVSKDFELYVLAMDDECYHILKDLNYNYLRPISLDKFENEQLKIAKSNRPFSEYCWTCSSSLLKYIFETFNPDNCTYVDADMYFYADPKILVEEMYERNCTVLVVGHRFSWYEKELSKIVGRYCVEFNTFSNEPRALALLHKWYSQCLEACYRRNDGIHYGDQMYIDKWCDDYDFVCETQNFGAGVAPWNIQQYKLQKSSLNEIKIRCRSKIFNLVFYHFENLQYIDKKHVYVNTYYSWGVDDNLVKLLYKPYLESIDSYKNLLFNVYKKEVLVKYHPAVAEPIKKSFMYHLKRLTKFKKILFVSIPTRLFYKKNLFTINS